MAHRFSILCTADAWTGPPRIAAALANHGAEICLVAPPESWAAQTRFKAADILCSASEINKKLPSLLKVVAEGFGAHSVLAGDTHAFSLLARLRAAAPRLRLGAATEEMITRSTPDAELALMLTRASAVAVGVASGPCPAPQSIASPSPDAALGFAREIGFPVLVKRDGCVAGEGVRLCDDEGALLRELAKAPMNSFEPGLLVQRLVSGRTYGVAVAGIEGRAAGGFAFEKYVIDPQPYGPASVLRYAERPDLVTHACALFERFGMNGYAGVDYIVDEDGRAYFLEINPCIVPKSHLTCFGADLTGAMLALLDDRPANAPTARTHEFAAIFPNEWRRDPQSPYLTSGLHDAPWNDPAVLNAMARTSRRRSAEDLRRLLEGRKGAGHEPDQHEHKATEADQHRTAPFSPAATPVI